MTNNYSLNKSATIAQSSAKASVKSSSPPSALEKGAVQAKRRRFALYARVSTEEQTKSNYPSCTSQIEELEQVCRTRGWEPYRRIKDEGFSAGTLKRPGLAEIRWLVQNEEIDGLVCTWYDRLTRSRDFYVLDTEFKAHNIQFVTLHDPADTRTASGRFMESMIVAAKTYDREQTSEKVRTKMRMRAAKGLHSGGIVPFGFVMNPETKLLSPDPQMASVLEQMFQVYVDERSDFAVRDWLQAHQIPNARGKMAWQVSTIRDMLCNRRYIGELEANKRNKGLDEVPENEAYHIIKAPHDAAVPLPLFQLAQSVRAEKLGQSPNRVGRPRHHSYTQCGRVNILQGTLLCGACGHAMTPHYTSKTAKVSESDLLGRQYFHYYACAAQIKGTMEEQHKNRIKADVIESWMLDTVEELLQNERIIDESRRTGWRSEKFESTSDRKRQRWN